MNRMVQLWTTSNACHLNSCLDFSPSQSEEQLRAHKCRDQNSHYHEDVTLPKYYHYNQSIHREKKVLRNLRLGSRALTREWILLQTAFYSKKILQSQDSRRGSLSSVPTRLPLPFPCSVSCTATFRKRRQIQHAKFIQWSRSSSKSPHPPHSHARPCTHITRFTSPPKKKVYMEGMDTQAHTPVLKE